MSNAPVVEAPAAPVDPLQQALITVIQKTTNAVEAGADFLAAQLPEVIQQLLMWHAIKAGILFLILASASFALLRLARSLWASAKEMEDSGDDGFIHVVGSFLLCAASGVAAMTSVNHGLISLQILIAPKVYLIEYAASLVK